MADPEAPAGPPRARRSPHRLCLAAAGLAIVVLGAAGLALGVDDAPTTPTSGSSRAGTGPAGAIELPRLNGEGSVSLASLRGRPVVVNFFASWCVPCRKEMPAFQE